MRNRVRLLAAAVALTAFGSAPAFAANEGAWPSARPIRLVVPFPPGGNSDLIARVYGQKLSEAIGQTVYVENRAGAAGAIGTAAVAKDKPDGYTFLLGDVATHVINRFAIANLAYDPEADFVPVSRLTSVSLAVLANKQRPFNTMQEFIAAAKAKPGSLTFASAGPGTPGRLAMEMLRAATGTDLVHVPYKGSSPAVNDLIGGQVDVMIDGSAGPMVKAGKLKVLAVTGDRSPSFPDAPTLAQAGVSNLKFVSWHGLFAPKGTPPEVVNRVAAELAKIGQQSAVRQQFADLGIDVVTESGPAFQAFIAQQRAAITAIVKDRKIRFDE